MASRKEKYLQYDPSRFSLGTTIMLDNNKEDIMSLAPWIPVVIAVLEAVRTTMDD